MTKDLGIKIGTMEQAFWQEIVNSGVKQIDDLEKMLKFQKAVLEMALIKLKEEKKWMSKK